MSQKMQKIFEQAQQLVNKAQAIVDALSLHIPGPCSQHKMPLSNIACDIATLTRNSNILWADINKEVRRP